MSDKEWNDERDEERWDDFDEGEPEVEAPQDWFGDCPECGGGDDLIAVGTSYWFLCHGCKTRWPGGGCHHGAFHRHNTEEIQKRNQALMQIYRPVKAANL
ncbi:MAG TPA: hypothetical protein VF627_11840 [Abditibacterium sp.]